MRKYKHYKKTQGVYKDFSGLRLKPSWVLSPCGVMDMTYILFLQSERLGLGYCKQTKGTVSPTKDTVSPTKGSPTKGRPTQRFSHT
jgi:hypothetical protein